MVRIEFIEAVADFYGSFSFDEFAEQLGYSTVELFEYLDDVIEDNDDILAKEMGYEEEENEEE